MSALWRNVSMWVIVGAVVAYAAIALFVLRAIRVVPRRPSHAIITASMGPELGEEAARWRRAASAQNVQRSAIPFMLIPRMLYRVLGVPNNELDQTAEWAAHARRLGSTDE